MKFRKLSALNNIHPNVRKVTIELETHLLFVAHSTDDVDAQEVGCKQHPLRMIYVLGIF